MLRVSLHPDGLAPRIANLAEWRAHVLDKLRQQIAASADPVLIALLDELAAFPAPAGRHGADHGAPHGGIAVPFRLATESGVLSFLSTTTVFGTPLDITLSEVAVESFFPADAATDAMLRAGLRTSRASV